jgi:glycosyltransferase XagB
VPVGGGARNLALQSLPADIRFLYGKIPLARLLSAVNDADKIGGSAHEVLLAHGVVAVDDYYAALAASIGARFSAFVGLQLPADPFVGREPTTAAQLGMLVVAGERGLEIAAAPRGRQVAVFAAALAARRGAARRVVVTTPQAMTDAIVTCGRDALLELARTGLGNLPRACSAAALLPRSQAIALMLVPILLIAFGVVSPAGALVAGSGLMAAFFLGVIGVRIAALAASLVPRRPGLPARLPDAQLPVYTVLVPLYREARLINGLIAALARLDYPAHKLDIKIIVESDDGETIAALRRRVLPTGFEVVVVPDSPPKTKPKALCFALALARGELVTVYDAEDVPAPDQLRRAAERFAKEPPATACLQASLAWYNWRENWFTRQIAIEYASLFDVLLPALDRLGLPFPLGGTSNHFRIDALREVGAWDAYNVTEDADLGLRLARFGYRCRTLASTTLEEAPVFFGPWLRQRTRWLKGWVQTYLIHMRRPGELLNRLGPLKFLAVQAVFGGVVVSTFLHPVFTTIVGVHVLKGDVFVGDGSWAAAVLAFVGGTVLVSGYASGFVIALVALRRRPMSWMLPELASLPVYWVLMSFAAARALLQLIHAPSHWEKTEHGLTRMAPPVSGQAPGTNAAAVPTRQAKKAL